MKFKKLDKNKATQTKRIYDSKNFDIDATFTINNQIITNIELEVVNEDNNIYHLVSAILCCDVIIKDSCYLQLNLIKQIPTNNNKKIKVSLTNCNLKIERDTLLFTNLNMYSDTVHEKLTCEIDVLGLHENPNSDNGNILIGRP